MDSLQASDAASAAVAVAPRVSLADIEAAIAHRFDTTARRALSDILQQPAKSEADFLPAATVESLGIMSICILVMKNGFVVTGTSAPASPENYDPEFGKKVAYQNAVRDLWPLMGYALRDRLAENAAKHRPDAG